MDGNISSIQISSALIELFGEIKNSLVEMSNLVSKMFVHIFELTNSGFSMMKGICQVCNFTSGSCKLGSEVTNRSIKMGNLVCKSSISTR